MKSAPTREGTTLYISELSSGIVVTLSIGDVGGGQQEKHIWKTSYPLLELLYPHWIPKQQVNTEVDFLSLVLHKSSQAFGWNFLDGARYITMPMSSFGDGVDDVVVVQEKGSARLTNALVAREIFSLTDRTTQKLGELIAAKADIHQSSFWVVVANFTSLEVIECIPRKIGGFTRWEYKVSSLSFATKEQQVEYFMGKKFVPFMASHIPENLLFNTLMNTTYWKPLSTSSSLLKDIWRSMMTSLVAEVGAHTTAAQSKRGTVYVTGEIPLFVQDAAAVQLAIVDGLGLSGVWEVVVDEQYQLIPLLSNPRVVQPFAQVGGIQTLWIIPQDKTKEKSTKVTLSGIEMMAVHGNMYTYSIPAENNERKIAIDSKPVDIELSSWLCVSQVTIDRRPWPVVYGPNSTANSVKVPLWLDRIKHTIR